MVYGHPPFHYCNGIVQKMKAIPDPNVPIQFPAMIDSISSPEPSAQNSTPNEKVKVPEAIINTMKRCLARNPKERATIPELLAEDWVTSRQRKF